MNTNNAPERITAKDAFELIISHHLGLNAAKGRNPEHSKTIRFARAGLADLSAMQPQVSESDEAVAQQIMALGARVERGEIRYADELLAEATALVASHRLPAAFTNEQIEEVCENTHHADICDQATRMRKVLETVEYGLKEGYLQDFLMGNGDYLSELVAASLSPETVCGGGE